MHRTSYPHAQGRAMPNEPSTGQSADIGSPSTRPFDGPASAATPNPDTISGQLGLHFGDSPMPEYEQVRKLGAGGFGEVWHARGPGGIDAALKFIRLDAGAGEVELRSLEVMKCIRHPNLVSLFGVWRTDNALILAMELCDRSLHDRLKEVRGQGLPGIPHGELLGYLRDAARGIDLLNDRHVQHRDVKPMNLL